MKSEFEKWLEIDLEKLRSRCSETGPDYASHREVANEFAYKVYRRYEDKIKKLVELNVDSAKSIMDKNEQLDQQAKIIEELKGALKEASKQFKCIIQYT